MTIKPGYKQTDAGVIPEEWQVQSIGKVMVLVNGCAFNPTSWRSRGIPIIRIQNLNDPNSPFNYCDIAVEDKYIIKAGDVLFAWSGTTGSSFGARIWNGPTGVLNQHIFKVIADGKKLLSYYSYLILQRVQSDIEKQAHGFKASFVHVKKTDLVKVPLPVPPLIEQAAISAALSEMDALLCALEEHLAKKRNIKQAVMQRLLAGQIRLVDRKSQWVKKRLGDVAHIKTGKKNNEDKVVDGNYSFFVRSDFVERINTYSYDCEAILIPGEGRVGEIFHFVSGRFDVHQRVYAITQFESNISPKFIYYYLVQKFGNWAMKHTVKATVDSLRLPILLFFEMLLPHSLDEQIAIANILSDMDTELASLEQHLAKNRTIKQAMMHELLTGKTRLVSPGETDV